MVERLKAVGNSLGEISADITDYRPSLRTASSDEVREHCVRMVALKRLAITANKKPGAGVPRPVRLAMQGLRTSREALLAEIMGDLDATLTRVENLQTQAAQAEQRLAASAAALDAASEHYSSAVHTFNEQAKTDLNDYLDLKSMQFASASSRTLQEQRAVLQEAVHASLQSHAIQRSRWDHLLQHFATALVTAILTSMLVLLVRLHF